MIPARTTSGLGRLEEAAGSDRRLFRGPFWRSGVPFSIDDLRAVKEAVPGVPVIANTGVRADSVAEIFKVADGAIVGTSLKVDGNTWNSVDPDRANCLMDAAKSARG